MTNLPQTKSILLELKHEWLTVWLNTPENRNALSDGLVGELRTTFDAIRDDRSVRGVTLRGKGGVFCAGGDLKSFSAAFHGDADHQSLADTNRRGGEFFAMINEAPQTVIALVEGAAIAGGLGLACCADVIAVTRDAKFSLTETQIGIVPAQIAPYIVHRVGLATARRLMLTGARFKGDKALSFGIADFVVDDADALTTLGDELRNDILRCAPNANAITKEIVFAATRLERATMMNFAADRFAKCLLSDEGREGISSFMEKRKPSWAPKS